MRHFVLSIISSITRQEYYNYRFKMLFNFFNDYSPLYKHIPIFIFLINQSKSIKGVTIDSSVMQHMTCSTKLQGAFIYSPLISYCDINRRRCIWEVTKNASSAYTSYVDSQTMEITIETDHYGTMMEKYSTGNVHVRVHRQILKAHQTVLPFLQLPQVQHLKIIA